MGDAIGEGAVPVAVDADDGVRGGVQDLLELTCGGVVEGNGAFAIGDVAVVEANAPVDGEDVDVDPEVERFVEVFDLLGNARLHDDAVGVFEIGADGFRKKLPVGLGVDVGGLEATDLNSFGVGEGDEPVAVEAEDGIG